MNLEEMNIPIKMSSCFVIYLAIQNFYKLPFLINDT